MWACKQWRVSLIAVVGIGAIVMTQSVGLGAEWSVEPSVSAKGEYNSNLLLRPGAQKGTYSHWISPGAKFAGSTESWKVSGKAASDFVQYYGGIESTITNLYFPLTAQYRGERSTWGLDGGFTRDPTLRGELLETGVVLSFTQRDLWNVAPTWTYNLTESLSLQSGYRFLDATYENGLRLGLVDYQVHNGNAGVSYRLNETDSVQISGIYSEFLAPQGNNLVSDTFGAQLSGSHALSERTTLTAGGGPRFLSNRVGTGVASLHDSTTAWVYNAKLTTKTERTKMALEISSQILPSGFGLLIQTDRVEATVAHELTENITISLDGSAYLVNGILSSPASRQFSENRYVRVTPAIAWRMNEWWTVTGSYTYSQRDVADFNQLGISNAARVMITYSPSKLSVGW
ncbi:MAG: hypothetical protein L0H94_00780 [Nitrospira sp.]|nr:hypothetical protein [Nitrospira sp.]